LSPDGSGYFPCIQILKLVTNKFHSGGLHEKHVVTTWNLGNHLSICIWTQGNQEKPVSSWPVADVDVDDDIEEVPENQLLPCTHTSSRSASKAFVVMLEFTDYFNTEAFFDKQIALQERNTKHLLTQIVRPMKLQSFLYCVHCYILVLFTCIP